MRKLSIEQIDELLAKNAQHYEVAFVIEHDSEELVGKTGVLHEVLKQLRDSLAECQRRVVPMSQLPPPTCVFSTDNPLWCGKHADYRRSIHRSACSIAEPNAPEPWMPGGAAFRERVITILNGCEKAGVKAWQPQVLTLLRDLLGRPQRPLREGECPHDNLLNNGQGWHCQDCGAPRPAPEV